MKYEQGRQEGMERVVFEQRQLYTVTVPARNS